MKNIEVKQSGTKLTLEIDTAKTFGPSKSGKTIIIATTEGNQEIEVAGKKVVIGLNVYTKEGK